MIIQGKAVTVTLIWSGLLSFVLLKIIDLTVGLRVSRDDEVEGLDMTLHGERIS